MCTGQYIVVLIVCLPTNYVFRGVQHWMGVKLTPKIIGGLSHVNGIIWGSCHFTQYCWWFNKTIALITTLAIVALLYICTCRNCGIVAHLLYLLHLLIYSALQRLHQAHTRTSLLYATGKAGAGVHFSQNITAFITMYRFSNKHHITNWYYRSGWQLL